MASPIALAQKALTPSYGNIHSLLQTPTSTIDVRRRATSASIVAASATGLHRQAADAVSNLVHVTGTIATSSLESAAQSVAGAQVSNLIGNYQNQSNQTTGALTVLFKEDAGISLGLELLFIYGICAGFW